MLLHMNANRAVIVWHCGVMAKIACIECYVLIAACVAVI